MPHGGSGGQETGEESQRGTMPPHKSTHNVFSLCLLLIVVVLQMPLVHFCSAQVLLSAKPHNSPVR